MDRNVTIRAIAIPVPSGDGKISMDRQGIFARPTLPDDAIGLSSIRFASALVSLHRPPCSLAADPALIPEFSI